MQSAAKSVLVVISVAALAACGSGQGDQQDNRDNAIEVNSSVVEVDTLPADESSATSSEELANGATEAPAETNAGY